MDDGVDITHPDLIGNLHSNGFDATGSRDDASPRSYDYHGTMVSGVATMKANNGIGGAGIAYNAKLIPVRVGYGNWIDDFYTFSWWLSSGINYAVNEGADILNLSWSVPGTTHNITSAINAAATNGRNGKGCIIFSSSGGNVQVRGQTCCTACGSNVSLISGYFGQYWDCGYGYMTVYPNPAGYDFVIDFETEKAGIEKLNSNLEFMLTITDNMGMVKYADRIYEFPHRVNTRNLSNGVYVIRVVYERKTYSARLVIDN